MKILFFSLFLLVAGLVLYALYALVRKTAYKQDERFLHCRLIPILFISLLLLTNGRNLANLLQKIDNLINNPGVSAFLQMVLPNRSYDLIYMLLMIIGLNIVVLLEALLVLLISKLFLRRKREFLYIEDYVGLGRLLRFPWMIAPLVYEEKDGVYRLNSRGVAMGFWAKGVKSALAVLTVAEVLTMAVSILWGSENWNKILLEISKAWYLMPMAGLVIVDQIHLFLEGDLDEQAGTFGSADMDEVLEGSMDALQQAYRETFSATDALIYADKLHDRLQDQIGLGSNDLGNQQILDCKQPDVLNVIVNQLQQVEGLNNEAYKNALVELLNEKSINVCDHCDGEFLGILSAYLNFYMAQGKTALVLCKDRDRADHLCEAIGLQMKKLNSLYAIWNVYTLEGAENNDRLSLLVCSYDDFLDYRISQKRQDFMQDVFCTVIADGTDLFCRDSVCIERIFNTLRTCDGPIQYILFTDVDNDALRTSMELCSNCHLIPVNGNSEKVPDTGIMVWAEESFHHLQSRLGIGNAMSPYIGTAFPLALVAAKYDFPRISIMPDEARGDMTFDEAMTMSAKEVVRYLGKNINLKSIIRCRPEEILDSKDISVMVVYDTDYNFLNALWRWIKYGGSAGALIHVVSPPYALREYFAANMLSDRKLLLKNNEFDALFASHIGMKASRMAVLLVSLCENGLTEERLMEKSREYNWSYETVTDLLKDCLGVALCREEIHSVYECFHFEEEKCFSEEKRGFVNCTRVTLTDSTIRSRIEERLGYAVLVVNDEKQYNIPVLRGNIHNYYLRGQIVPVGGHLYQISAIQGSKILADQIMPRDVPEYYQVSSFAFHDTQLVDNCVDTGVMDLNIYSVSLTRSVFGYWSANRGTKFTADCDLQANNFTEEGRAGQEISLESANVLEINIKRSAFGDKAQEAMQLLAFLLKDLSRTLFPKIHQNLFVAIPGDRTEQMKKTMEEGRESSVEDMILSLIPCVIGAPASNPNFCTLYVIEASCIEYGMVQMLRNELKSVLQMVREYLNWYVTPCQTEGEAEAPAAGIDFASDVNSMAENVAENEAAEPVEEKAPVLMNGSYLHFGQRSIPAVFCTDGLLSLCRKVFPEEVEQTPAADHVVVKADAKLCTFCGRETLFWIRLSDGRLMCQHCKDHQMTQRDEIKTLFLSTVDFMEDGYGIKLPRNIHVRFQSAADILKAAGEVDGGRILGFYNNKTRQLWLEARGPKIAMQSTLIHELTHAWQFTDPVFQREFERMLRKIPKRKRAEIRLLLLEGHAVFMEIETMRKLHENTYADNLLEMTLRRGDEYGLGYRLIHDYIVERGAEGSYMTPFAAMTQLVRGIAEGTVTINEQTN